MSTLPTVPTSGAVLAQNIAVAVVRAGLSSIPFAALAWDWAAAGLNFVNQQSAEAFLDELADRVSELENYSGGLGSCAQTAAHEALLRLIQEDSEEFAREVANAVAAIEASDVDPRLLRQVATALTHVNSRTRTYLGVIFRLANDRLTAAERQILLEIDPYPPGTLGDGESIDVLRAITALLERHYPSISVDSDLRSLQAAGLITLPDIRLIIPTGEPWEATPVRLTDLGETVLGALTPNPEFVPPFSDLFKPQ